MNWDTLFSALNLVALVAWLPLVLAPRPAWLVELLRVLVVGGLCALYVALIATALTVGFGERPGPTPDFTTIPGIRALFGSDAGVVIGWTHYLAFDLFTGIWIAVDADRRGIGRIVQAPVLALTFLAGPVGLLLHLLLSRTLWKAVRVA